MKTEYIALIGAPTPGTDEGWQAVVPQIEMCWSLGYDYEDAKAMIKEALVLNLESWLEDRGHFPECKPLEEYQETIDTVEDGGPAWERIVLKVDLDEVRQLIKHKAAFKIQKIVRSKSGRSSNPQRHVINVIEQDSIMEIVYNSEGALLVGARGNYENYSYSEDEDDDDDLDFDDDGNQN